MNEQVEYARSGEIHIAYQVTGRGSRNIVFVPGFLAHLEFQLEEPSQAAFFRRLASLGRLIRFDKRGCGLSDRDASSPTLEERADDLRAVMDQAGALRATLIGLSEGGPLSLAFAAAFPERVEGVVLLNSFAKMGLCDEQPWGTTDEEFELMGSLVQHGWGQGQMVNVFAADAASDAAFCSWWTRFERLAMSPGAAAQGLKWIMGIDVRTVLPLVQTPTLVVCLTGDASISSDHSRYLSERIDGAKLIELPGRDHFPWRATGVLDAIEEFLTGARGTGEAQRVLGTVLSTDVVGSTEIAAEVGDRKWRELLEEHDRIVRSEVEAFGGKVMDTAGDGVLALFDGPGRAARCAFALGEAIAAIGLQIRAGLHTGEVELRAEGIAGMAVHIGARIGSLAPPGKVLASGTVKDLTVGAGFSFDAYGVHTLKGVPGEWSLFLMGD
jgi:pimeloyl-ACP methyl ester carboxylesterase